MQISRNIPTSEQPKWKANLDEMKIAESSQIDNRHYNSVKATLNMHLHHGKTQKNLSP